MKAVSRKFFVKLVGVFLIALVISCSKNEETEFQRKSQSYKLYDTTAGMNKQVGIFTIAELEAKNAKLTIQLDTAARAARVTTASIVAKDTLGIEYRYAKLADINAATGISETALLVNDSAQNIKYADIITSKGFWVKITTPTTAAITGPIQ
jgi:hypothetical protein